MDLINQLEQSIASESANKIAEYEQETKQIQESNPYKINDDGNEDSETGSAEQERDFYLFINDDDNLVMRYNNCDSDCDSVFSRSEDEEDDGQDDASGENENCDDCDSADEGSEDNSKSK